MKIIIFFMGLKEQKRAAEKQFLGSSAKVSPSLRKNRGGSFEFIVNKLSNIK
jgi:hypothetical protein